MPAAKHRASPVHSASNQPRALQMELSALCSLHRAVTAYPRGSPEVGRSRDAALGQAL